MNERSIQKHERRIRRNAILGGVLFFAVGLGFFFVLTAQPADHDRSRRGTFSLGVKSESVSAESSAPYFSDTSWGSSSRSSASSSSAPEPTTLLLMMPATLVLLRRSRRA